MPTLQELHTMAQAVDDARAIYKAHNGRPTDNVGAAVQFDIEERKLMTRLTDAGALYRAALDKYVKEQQQ